MAPSRIAGRGLGHSSSSSGIFFQGEGQSLAGISPHLSSSFGNSSHSSPGTAGRSNLDLISGDISNNVLQSVGNSGPSVGASSLVTDANSGLSGGPHLQRSGSFNTESYIRLPPSPMSFSSNNISFSASSIMDGSTVVQQNSQQDHNSHGYHTQLQNQQHSSSATSGSFIQEPNGYLSQTQKKPRLDIKQEGGLQQQAMQQILQRQDSMQLQGHNPQLQVLLNQQRLRQQQQYLQSMPNLQRAQLQQQQQQQHQQMMLRSHMQPQSIQPGTAAKRTYDSGICARRLMQYLYHQRQRPQDNNIVYWRKFVAEYYSPRAKKRWCLSKYENVGHHALGVFPQAAMDSWQCDICRSKTGRGFEATAEVIPRLNEIKFSSGVIDELLFLDYPHECRFPSGIMMLEYGKAVQESVYEQLRVVREGRLRIIFTQELKILSWEFCALRHEELLPRRILAPQVNELLQVAQKCQSTIAESGSDGISQQELQTNSNKVLTAGRQLARSLDMQSLNDLGFSKRYVRCLQIAEVVNSMKDLMGFCAEQKVGPIEGLKSYPRHNSVTKLQIQEMEQLESARVPPTNPTTINTMMAAHPGLKNPMINNQALNPSGNLSGPAQAALAMTNYQNLLNRQNSRTSNPNSLPHDASAAINNPTQIPSSVVQGQSSLVQGSMPNLPVGGFPNAHFVRSFKANNGVPQQSHQQTFQSSQALQQRMFEQLLQEMSNNGGASEVQLPTFSGQSGKNENNTSAAGRNKVEFRNNAISGSASAAPRARPTTSASARSPSPTSSISNSQKPAPANSSSNAGGVDSEPKVTDLPKINHIAEEEFPDIASEFMGNGFFNQDFGGNLDFCWDSCC
uniref:Transcriptional regulator SLK2 n=1 Tax=Kalanchoe fedtschenkoi TaxID=63787 RepID=A0A7N1A4G2_KALFE